MTVIEKEKTRRKVVCEHDAAVSDAEEKLPAKEEKTSFGERLAALRKQQGLTAAEFGKSLGVNGEFAVGMLENNMVLPSAELLIKIAELYPADIHELLVGRPSPAVE